VEATVGKSRKAAKASEGKKRQPNPWGHFRAAAPVELGQGGVKFVRRENGKTCALPCGADNNTVSAVLVSYDMLSIELPQIYSRVKETRGQLDGRELREQFQDSPLVAVTDEDDWNDWAQGFSPQNPQRGRPKSAALTFLERKMALDRGTIKSYLSRSKKASKT
jgi:hypothetical protein